MKKEIQVIVRRGRLVEFEDKMLIIRYSQNGPYLTIKFESKKIEDYNFLKNYINQLLHNYKELDWHSKMNVNIAALDPKNHT